ncbi:MAG TPA: hypothetical protein VMR74_06835 [Gammaproteobacteria bacterium]|nr:hypothetical protein [Gammaproteobacteria bacterium]
MPTRIRIHAAGIVLLASALAVTGGAGAQEIRFVAATPALEYAVRAYQAIWEDHGEDIVVALEARTCLRFPETSVSAIVADATSNSGGPEYPMRLRASYAPEAKQSTLVHELGHRHLWQLEERLDEVDGHKTLYLVLDLVWQDVWGEEFAKDRVRGESEWRSNYDYAEAWSWARSLDLEERARLWDELLAANGFFYGCNNPIGLEE